MSTNNICFYGELEKIIPEFIINTLLNNSPDSRHYILALYIQMSRNMLKCIFVHVYQVKTHLFSLVTLRLMFCGSDLLVVRKSCDQIVWMYRRLLYPGG